ncbi:MAG: polysaccharide deacetylase family protein, partial [Planctomycetes bacterium]|nr:polysaccharide deacetylase family protein [Planctomycetota bacterium]
LDIAGFRRQLDLLCSRAEPITWPQFHAWHQGSGTIPETGFLLTFDDGLSDHAEVVAPLLEDRGLRGVFFVPGQVLDSGRMASAHQIHLLQATLGDEAFADAVCSWLTDNYAEGGCLDQPQIAQAHRVYHYEPPERAELKYRLAFALPIDVRRKMIDSLFAAHLGDEEPYARRWYLDGRQVAALQRAGHTIGGHGFDHEPYLRLSGDDQVRDLSRSAKILDDLIGPGPRPFSYPYGSFDNAVARRCRQAGFCQAMTTRPGWVGCGSDAWALDRVDTIDLDRFLEQEQPCPSSRSTSPQPELGRLEPSVWPAS